jgi:hypothetical protein
MTEYTIIVAGSAGEMEAEVNKHLASGWNLKGDLFVHESLIMQAMVRATQKEYYAP